MPRHNKSIKHIKLIIINCNSKREFKNKNEASEAAEYQMLIKPNLELFTYKCNLWNKWHLTRSPN